MRQLALLTFVLAFSQCLFAEVPASQSSTTPGAIRLLEGFRHERLHGIDSAVGRIWKEGGLEIHYDIGRMAGNYAASVKGPDRAWAITQIVNGRPVDIVKSKDGRVIVTFTKDFANFYAKVASEQDLAALLAITLTYPATPAAE